MSDFDVVRDALGRRWRDGDDAGFKGPHEALDRIESALREAREREAKLQSALTRLDAESIDLRMYDAVCADNAKLRSTLKRAHIILGESAGPRYKRVVVEAFDILATALEPKADPS